MKMNNLEVINAVNMLINVFATIQKITFNK